MSAAPLIVTLKGLRRTEASGRVECRRNCTCTSRAKPTTNVGKGMAAGKIVLKPRRAAQSTFIARDNEFIMGKYLSLTGATGGETLCGGHGPGERFARAQFGGARRRGRRRGDHCCEYMTGRCGCACSDATGVNFGAGFTGGFAYVLDMEAAISSDRYNHELIDIHRVSPEGMGNPRAASARLDRTACRRHGQASGALNLLNDFRSYIGKFWVVKPKAGGHQFSTGKICGARLDPAPQSRDFMPANHLQFLDIPRKGFPTKLAVEVRHQGISRNLFPIQAPRRASGPSRTLHFVRQSLLRVESARFTITFRTGWRW